MPSRRRLISVGILTFLAGLIILFPARVAYQWFGPDVVAVGGIRGSVWSGSAEHASGSGVYVTELRWQFRPLRLFTGKLVYAITAKPASGFLEGEVGLGFGGTIHVTDLQATIGLQALEQVAAIRGMRGNATIRFDRLTMKDGVPVAAKGTVDVSDLVIPFVTASSIGGYRAEFFTQQDAVIASVEDTDGTVDIAGSLELSADGNYQFLGQLAAKPETPQGVRQQMQFLGTANDRGQYELRLEGQL